MKTQIFALLALAVLLSSCAPSNPAQGKTAEVCGDGYCTSLEYSSGSCPSDCSQEEEEATTDTGDYDDDSQAYMAGCLSEGEIMPVTPDAPSCCSGLELIPPKESTEKGHQGICTAYCGNGVCNEDSESNKNCPSDCEFVLDSQISCEGIGTSKVGWYQNGKIISYAYCEGCTAVCKFKGGPSEGWYSSCTDKQIKRMCN